MLFEVAFVDEWQVTRDRKKLEQALREKLAKLGVRGRLRVQLDRPMTIPDFQLWSDTIASWAAGQPNGKASSERLLYHDPGVVAERVHFDLGLEPDAQLSVKCRAPNITPLTSHATAVDAREHAQAQGAIVAAPEGVSIVDHIRKRVRKKINRQMEPGWTGILVLVARIDIEPHVSWDIVLEQVLAGDELVSVNVDDHSDVQMAQVENTGVWRGGLNTRLSGAIGITIDHRGRVLEMTAHARTPDALPEVLRELMRVRIDHGSSALTVPAVLSGTTSVPNSSSNGSGVSRAV